jgi:hypothetical protein
MKANLSPFIRKARYRHHHSQIPQVVYYKGKVNVRGFLKGREVITEYFHDPLLNTLRIKYSYESQQWRGDPRQGILLLHFKDIVRFH